MSRILDRIFEMALMRTNSDGAKGYYAVGNLIEQDDGIYRVTRHKVYATVPRETVVVWGRRVR